MAALRTYLYNYVSGDRMIALGKKKEKGVIYNHSYSDYSDYAIGHIGADGIVYDDPYSELGEYAVGYVGDGDVAYKDSYSMQGEYDPGYVNTFVIYDAPYTELESAVGHVNRDGYIYGEPRSEVDCLIGRYEGDPREAGAVALLLMREYLKKTYRRNYTETYNKGSSYSSGSSTAEQIAHVIVGVTDFYEKLWKNLTRGPKKKK